MMTDAKNTCFEQMSNAPRLLVIAGPNGSGKTTVTRGLSVEGFYVNADEIMRVRQCAALEAAIEAEHIRENLLKEKADFTFETVLSTDRNLQLLDRAKQAGYEIAAVYVLTGNSAINVRRVAERVANGGHPVPEDKIKNRYKKSVANLSRLVRIADHTRIIDNSEDTPVLICEVKNGQAVIYDNPIWRKEEILRLLS